MIWTTTVTLTAAQEALAIALEITPPEQAEQRMTLDARRGIWPGAPVTWSGMRAMPSATPPTMLATLCAKRSRAAGDTRPPCGFLLELDVKPVLEIARQTAKQRIFLELQSNVLLHSVQMTYAARLLANLVKSMRLIELFRPFILWRAAQP